MLDSEKDESEVTQVETGFPDGYIVLEWISSASNDMIADAAIAVIMGIDASPASVKRAHAAPSRPNMQLTHVIVTSKAHPHADHVHENEDDAASERVLQLLQYLEQHFGNVEFIEPDEDDMRIEDGMEATEPSLRITIDDEQALINMLTMVCAAPEQIPLDSLLLQAVTSDSDPLREHVEDVLEMALATFRSLHSSYVPEEKLSVATEGKDFFINTIKNAEELDPVDAGDETKESMVD